jgi:hypothetical protein
MGDHPVDLQAFYAAQHADDERNCQKRQNESFFHKIKDWTGNRQRFPGKKRMDGPATLETVRFQFET